MPELTQDQAQNMGRLLSRVVDRGKCWLWGGSTNGVGYGVISHRGRRTYTHRLSYETCRGPIPRGFVIDHLCCMPLCFNPDHLEPVTHSTNIRRAESADPLPARPRIQLREHLHHAGWPSPVPDLQGAP
jgi:hypothetical protein